MAGRGVEAEPMRMGEGQSGEKHLETRKEESADLGLQALIFKRQSTWVA